MNFSKIIGCLFACLLLSLPAFVSAQPPRIVVITDAGGFPGGTCTSAMEEFVSSLDSSMNDTFCATFIEGSTKVHISEVFAYSFCNILGFDSLILKVTNVDNAGNVLSFDWGSITSQELFVLADIHHPVNSLPSGWSNVNRRRYHTEVTFNLDYDLLLPLGRNTTHITTTYQLFHPSSSASNGLSLIEQLSRTAPTCYVHAGSNSRSTDQLNSSLIGLFPNPAHQFLTISGLSAESQEVQLLDLQGKQYPIQDRIATPKGVKLDVSGLSPGMYLLRIQTPSGWTTHKWVKE